MFCRINKASRVIPRHFDTLLVTGDGHGLKSDLAKFRRWGVPHDVAAIGRSVKLVRATHWFNADGETAMSWAEQLREQGIVTHTLGNVRGFDVDWEMEAPDYGYEEITGQRGRMHGSSALFATLAGIAMGYQDIVLAGCPLDTEGHWYFKPDSPETLGPLWLGVDYQAWLDFSQQPDSDKVTSMSGYTALILGEAAR